jgi:hypothetical protein
MDYVGKTPPFNGPPGEFKTIYCHAGVGIGMTAEQEETRVGGGRKKKKLNTGGGVSLQKPSAEGLPSYHLPIYLHFLPSSTFLLSPLSSFFPSFLYSFFFLLWFIFLPSTSFTSSIFLRPLPSSCISYH